MSIAIFVKGKGRGRGRMRERKRYQEGIPHLLFFFHSSLSGFPQSLCLPLIRSSPLPRGIVWRRNKCREWDCLPSFWFCLVSFEAVTQLVGCVTHARDTTGSWKHLKQSSYRVVHVFTISSFFLLSGMTNTNLLSRISPKWSGFTCKAIVARSLSTNTGAFLKLKTWRESEGCASLCWKSTGGESTRWLKCTPSNKHGTAS